jgi:hypothetical protein
MSTTVQTAIITTGPHPSNPATTIIYPTGDILREDFAQFESVA